MTVTEFAILVLKSPPDFLDPTLLSLFQKISAWQSECSGFPLLFFTDPRDSHRIYLVTGWASVAAHEAWIRGERNQELLRVFAPYIDMPKLRMVHLDVDFEVLPNDAARVIVERYAKGAEWTVSESDRSTWSLFGRDLAQDGGDVFRFVGIAAGSGESEVRGGVLAPSERWVLERVWCIDRTDVQ